MVEAKELRRRVLASYSTTDASEVQDLFVEAGFHDSRILRVSELGESWDNVFIGFGQKP